MSKQSKPSNKYLLLLFVLFFSIKLSAQEAIEDSLALHIENQPYLKLQEMVDCEVAFTTIEKRICTNLEFQRYNRLMSGLVNQLIEEFDMLGLASERTKFIEQQQEWIEYRNEECTRLKGAIKDVDMILEDHLESLISLTIERIEVLESVMTEE